MEKTVMTKKERAQMTNVASIEVAKKRINKARVEGFIELLKANGFIHEFYSAIPLMGWDCTPGEEQWVIDVYVKGKLDKRAVRAKEGDVVELWETAEMYY